MGYALVGPFPLDLKTVIACGRLALSSVGQALRSGAGDELVSSSSATGEEPGLYIVLELAEEGGGHQIAGFWATLSGDYLAQGPVGPPDRVPPLTQDLLDAATEEVWWQSLQVNEGSDGVWRPMIVLEWPSHLSNRSALPPPGVYFDDPGSDSVAGTEQETWLEQVDHKPVDGAATTELPNNYGEREQDKYTDVSEVRSLIVAVRGTLSHDGRLHKGSFFMLPPELFEEGTNQIKNLDEWLSEPIAFIPEEMDALEREDNDRHHLGRALELPGNRIGFHSSGWLTRSLGIWPARPSDVAVGYLTDRVVQKRWISQARLAVGSSLLVLGTVLLFSGAVQKAATPVAEAIPAPPPPAPQPALSVCSADYPDFVKELRCQVARLSEGDGGVKYGAVCGDRGSRDRWEDDGRDLQATYCALRDRSLRDGWQAQLDSTTMVSYADLVAAQACYNVLGHPQPYKFLGDSQFDASNRRRELGDPERFLLDEQDSIQPLIEVSVRLNEACDTYYEQVESRVKGAVFATHVGGTIRDEEDRVPPSVREPSEFRKRLRTKVVSGMRGTAETCFNDSLSEGLRGLDYSGLCGETQDTKDREYGRSDKFEIWRKLGSSDGWDTEETLIERYAATRFSVDKTKDELWKCHLALSGEGGFEGVSRSPVGAWDIRIPVPKSYDVTGRGARNQLTLDATLTAFDSSSAPNAGVCWGQVAKMLSSYRPVHPLFPGLGELDWPTVEQQLCGQICSARFNLQASLNNSDWFTKDADLAQCIHADAGPKEDNGAGVLDKLRLPWNYSRRGEWQETRQSQICAFNLVAQEQFPTAEEDAPYIVGGIPGKEFGGETFTGSRIVGGNTGEAVKYVEGLTFNRKVANKGRAACGHVATQCFSSIMLEVTGDEKIKPYRWLGAWQERIDTLSEKKRYDVRYSNPWCHGIYDYLNNDKVIDDLDAPCQAGVAEARANAKATLELLEERGSVASVTGGN